MNHKYMCLAVFEIILALIILTLCGNGPSKIQLHKINFVTL